ncbi:hypothetical protein CFC21_082588 [Triticum aestivum]|uniref:F-box domain-containing protein n=2 Tax=Triticum aestivum TaxID=4565 RepID=A0A3B6NMB2_WHEAT|nr:hypothetical protein CFC21_082588 [Triticum aestivum]
MAPPLPSLTSDCLLHVFLGLDPLSILRCAAVSRHWRRAVIDNAAEIRRHPGRHLLLGIYHHEMYPGELAFSRRSSWLPPSAGRHWSDSLPAPSHVPVAEGTTPKLYSPLACSGGLVLVCQGLPSEMCVCNPFTGFGASIPRLGELVTHEYLLHSCHGIEPNPSPNTFQGGAWGPVFRPNGSRLRMPYPDYRAAPVLCRGAIHWLCGDVSDYDSSAYMITHIVAVDISTGQARMARLPNHLLTCNHEVSTKKMLMLATSSEGERLSLLRTEKLGLEVSIWLYARDHGGGGDDVEESWMLSRSVDVQKLVEDAGLAYFRSSCKDWVVLETRLEWFCPRSNRLIIWIPFLGLFVLDLVSTEIQRADGDSHGHIWPYEIDLTLSFSSMKPF